MKQGKPLNEYPSGRLPELLKACVSGSFGIKPLKDLLMYRGFVLKDEDAARSLISFGIEKRCLRNTSLRDSEDIWISRLKASGKPDLLAWYRKLKKKYPRE